MGTSQIQNRISQSHKTITIGVLGTTKGSGSSHLTFALSTYFNKNKTQTALVERTTGVTFEKIEEAYEGLKFKAITSKFTIKKCTFYKNYKGLLSDIKNEKYQVVIVDFGFGTIPKEFYDMDIKIIIGNGNEWKLHEFERFVNKKNTEKFTHIINLGNTDEVNLFHRRYKSNAISFPYIKDPFLWDKQLNKVVESILNI